MRKTFGATIRLLEVKAINEFIKEVLVLKDDLKAVVLMLVTSLYFKADWETPFN